MMKFRCFIEELSYLDVPSIRGPFTSFNRAGTSMSGLGSNEDWGPKSFKFNNCWLKHKDFSNFVDKEWRSFKVMGRGDFVLKEKLKLLKISLKR
ncbi:unnamed protein product [Lathyrus oleraceus]